MCKLIFAISGSDHGISQKAELSVLSLSSGIETETDGLGVLCARKKGKHTRFYGNAKLDKDDYDISEQPIQGTKFFGAHSRKATTGTTDEINIHFGEYKGTYFAHNGFVGAFAKSQANKEKKGLVRQVQTSYGYGLEAEYYPNRWDGAAPTPTKQEHVDSDSLCLQKELANMKHINKESVWEKIISTRFSGCATFVTKDSVYIIVHSHYRQTEMREVDGVLIFTSYKATPGKIMFKKQLHGVDILEERKVDIPEPNIVADGIYQFKL